MSNEVIEWHDDCHSMSIMLNKTAFVIDSVTCPVNGGEGNCFHPTINGCIVTWFLERYGFDCNVGIAPAASSIEIAWALVADSQHDIDACQVWVIPTNDDVYSAWATSQKQEKPTTGELDEPNTAQ